MRNAVLITRPEGEAGRTASLLRARSFEPVIAPVLQIQTLHPTIPQDVQGLLVTSGNALVALDPWPVPVLAVGDVTAEKARARGFTDVESARGDAAALAALAVRRFSPHVGRLLIATGAGQGGALLAALRRAGFRVCRRKTYVSAPIKALPETALAVIEAGQVHAAMFLSADTAKAFIAALPCGAENHLSGTLALAIGEGAADALKPVPWRDIRIAARPTLEDVLALL